MKSFLGHKADFISKTPFGSLYKINYKKEGKLVHVDDNGICLDTKKKVLFSDNEKRPTGTASKRPALQVGDYAYLIKKDYAATIKKGRVVHLARKDKKCTLEIDGQLTAANKSDVHSHESIKQYFNNFKESFESTVK